MIKRTNLNIHDAACLIIVHILQHPTSRPTIWSTQTTIVKAAGKTFSPPPAGRYCKSTTWSTWWHHQTNKGKSGFEVKSVRALGPLRSFWSKKKIAAENQQDTHFRRNEEKKKRIKDYVERESAEVGMRFEDAGAAIEQEQEMTRTAENTGLTTRVPRKTFQVLMLVIRDSLSDLANPDNGQVLAEADEAWQIDTTGMGGRSRLLQWKRYEVWHINIEGCGSHYTANEWWCRRTCTHIIWRAYVVSWYYSRNIANTARDFSLRKKCY